MDKRFIEYLINNKPEGILLDFKGAFYDKLDKPKYNKEIRKDISAFANSTKNKYQSAYIIVGYNEESSTFQDVDYADVGDEAKIQDLVNNVVKPKITT
jgi:predicted HTH transcriptional regulator